MSCSDFSSDQYIHIGIDKLSGHVTHRFLRHLNCVLPCCRGLTKLSNQHQSDWLAVIQARQTNPDI